jgi:hypothetical protein
MADIKTALERKGAFPKARTNKAMNPMELHTRHHGKQMADPQ